MAGSPVSAGGSGGLLEAAGGNATGGTAAGRGGAPGVGGALGLGGSSAGAGGEVSVSGSGGLGGALGGSGANAGAGVGGALPSSGAGGGAGQPSGGAPPTDGFTLLFRDDFDALDAARWQIMTHSWSSNLALFSSQSVSVSDGELSLRLLAAPSGTVDDTGASKPYFGAEVRSTATLTYGRVRARAKLASGSAVVSALVTIYTPWPADNWNELDIECLGQDSSKVQLNTMVYTGPPLTPPVTSSVTPTQTPHMESLGFDASADFHLYTLEWTPAGAIFLIDDVARYTWTENIALMTLPQNVLMTIWASSSPEWAGAVTASTVGASATYDWIELYTYAAP